MKLVQTIKIRKTDSTVKKYKFCGITVLRKEKTPTKKKYTFLGIPISIEKNSKKIIVNICGIKIKYYSHTQLLNPIKNSLKSVFPSPEDIQKTFLALATDVDVISFDVFDTLLIRPYVKPTDVFMHMENYYNIKDFCKARIEAEERARIIYKQSQDITIDNIYEQILPKFRKYKNKEIAFEKQILQKHPHNFNLYQQAVKLKKKVIITSDMYLSTKTIQNILQTNDYLKINKLYVSCDYNKTKGSGDLFQQILIDYNIPPHKLLHIGDNTCSDIKIPTNLGIKILQVPKYIDYFAQFNENQKYINFYNNFPNLDSSIITSRIAIHKLFKPLKNYWNEIGYCLAAPLAIGYISDIIKEAQKNEIDELLFVARDGYILQKVYNKISPNPLPNHYIYAPRILNMKCFGDYRNNLEYQKKYIKLISEMLGRKISDKDINQSPYKEKIKEWLDKNKNNYIKYLKTLNIKGKNIASVDMTTGAFTSEVFLSKILGNNYAMAFFSGTFYHNLKYKYHTYLDREFNPQTDLRLVTLMELLITAPELPIIDIKNRVPVYKESNKYDVIRKQISSEIEKGVALYLKENNSNISINIDIKNILRLLDSFCNNMTDQDIAEIKNIYHAGDSANEDMVSLYDIIKNRK